MFRMSHGLFALVKRPEKNQKFVRLGLFVLIGVLVV